MHVKMQHVDGHGRTRGAGRYIPSLSNVWPWDLFMVIEYASLTGNCILCSVNGRLAFDGASLTRGMRTVCVTWLPVRISASSTCSWRCLMYSLVPLHSPLVMSRLRNSMIIALGFKMRRCGGMPFGVIE